MDYKKIYDEFINKRRNRQLENNEYYEKHHILPKSLGGSNDDDNLIYLNLREHYFAHELLERIYLSKEMSYALYMMSILIKDAEINENVKRNKYYKNGGKRIVSSRIYEKCKIEYIKNKKKKKYNDIEKENVSKGTKKAMRTRENINKTISGSKDCKFYYDKITKKVFKWFKGDEDIDLNIYAWGRYHISDETKNKLSELSKIPKTYYYIKELDIKYTAYDEYIIDVPKTWEKKWVNNRNMELRKMIIRAVREFNLITDYVYHNKIIFNYPNKSKNFIIITPSLYELCYESMVEWKERDITNDLVKSIIKNIDKIIELNKKYINYELS